MRALVCLLGVLVPSAAYAVFCPCYSSTSISNPNNCGVAEARGPNPTVAEWQGIIEDACSGPNAATWGDGPSIGPIGSGCGATATKVPAHFPCELIEALAMQESHWVQFCASTEPADKIGNGNTTLIAKDCGYGIAQVTTGMHRGETPAWDRARVASDSKYSLQVGLSILADKWHSTACVGDNDPDVVESWYLAAWAYNSYSFANNPNNPNYDAVRPVCDPSTTCTARPYQEKLWAWMEHPPDARWSPISPAYPDPSEIPSTSGAKIGTLSTPKCNAATTCDLQRDVHVSRCAGQFPLEDLGTTDSRSADGGGTAIPPSGGCGCTVGGAARIGSLPAVWLSLWLWLWLRPLRRGRSA